MLNEGRDGAPAFAGRFFLSLWSPPRGCLLREALLDKALDYFPAPLTPLPQTKISPPASLHEQERGKAVLCPVVHPVLSEEPGIR